MLSVAKAAKDYYLQKLEEISPREDYYLRGGTATGIWHGSGAAELGLSGTVSTEGLVRLFDGCEPATGDQLGRRLRTNGVAAWDLTFSADKSVSLLWALGDAEVRRQVLEGFEAATSVALGYLESVASSTRGAARVPVVDQHGLQVVGDDGKPKVRVETWPIRTHGYVAAWFTEFTSRENDPQLHTHVVVGNRVKGVDGVWRALDGTQVYQHKLAAGYLHEAELRRQLTQWLGVRWQEVRNGLADIEGFTRVQVMEFSRRRRQIETWRQAQGLDDTAAAYEAATLATRTAKNDHSLDQLLPDWKARAEQVGLTREVVAGVTGRDRSMTRPDPEALFARLAGPEGLTAHASTFRRGDVIQAIAAAMPEGGTRSDIERLAEQFLKSPEVVPILPMHPGMSRVPVGSTLNGKSRSVDQLISKHGRSRGMRGRDGHVFPGLIYERQYTTVELLTVEQQVIARAEAGVGAGRFRSPMSLIERTLSRHPELTVGQRNLVHKLATSGNAIEVVVGAAGTGKTAVMAAVRELAKATSNPIMGAALAGRAAAELQTHTGIRSTTICRLLAEEGGGVPLGSIVVVDEAGMVGSRQLAQLVDLTEAANGKLILLGDHRQLAEIDAGGLFCALAERQPTLELTENVRQQAQWERTALTELRDGSAGRALAMYLSRGRIVVEPTPQATIYRAVGDWHHYVTAAADVRAALLIAHDNATVIALNQLAREHMSRTGRLHGPDVQIDQRNFQAGDRVICLRNRPGLGVLNGDLAEIVATEPDSGAITIQLDRDGQQRRIPAWYLHSGYLDHGYAITGHKAQGATVNRAFVIGGPAIYREWGYVAMSRGRDTNTLYLAQPDLGETCTHITHLQPRQLAALANALDRSSAQAAAVDSGRGPRYLEDHELSRRLREAESGSRGGFAAESTTLGRHPSIRDLELALLRREAALRHRDRLALIAYQPPAWVASTIGERPADPAARAVWDGVVGRALAYRTRHDVGDEAIGIIGPPPPTSCQAGRVDWITTGQAIRRDLKGLRREAVGVIERVV